MRELARVTLEAGCAFRVRHARGRIAPNRAIARNANASDNIIAQIGFARKPDCCKYRIASAYNRNAALSSSALRITGVKIIIFYRERELPKAADLRLRSDNYYIRARTRRVIALTHSHLRSLRNAKRRTTFISAYAQITSDPGCYRSPSCCTKIRKSSSTKTESSII